MKAVYKNQEDAVVWECTKDVRYEWNNHSKAIQKGAKKGYLYDDEGKLIDEVKYGPF